jgi:hypothetical protein
MLVVCDNCAEKWPYGHKCASTAQLHAIHELWELFPSDHVVETSSHSSNDISAQLCVVLSAAAESGVESPRSMRLWGQIQG